MPAGPRLPPLVQGYLYSRHPAWFLARAQRRYGDVFTLRLSGEGRVVMVADPNLVREVVSGPPEVIRAGEANARMRGLLGRDSLLVVDGEEHMETRRSLTPALHGDSVRIHENLVADLTGERVKRWQPGKPISMHRESRVIMSELILAVVLGQDESKLNEMRSLLLRVTRVTPLIGGWLTHGWLQAVPPWRGYAAAVRGMNDAIDGMIDARRGDEDLRRRTDVLSALSRSDPSDAAWLKAQVMTLLVAHDTTAATLAWAVELLGRHPGIRARAREDTDEYLDAVVTEVLRLRPALPGAARMLAQGTEIGGHGLPAGTVVAASGLLMSVDPRLYDAPGEFRPDRWLRRRPGTYTWLPFGGGRRRCIGATFAQMELRVALRAMLERMDWQAVGRKPERQEIRLSIVPHRGAVVLRTR